MKKSLINTVTSLRGDNRLLLRELQIVTVRKESLEEVLQDLLDGQPGAKGRARKLLERKQ